MRLKLNRAGVNQLLRVEVKDDMHRRARAVATRASAGLTEPEGMTVIDASDGNRARYIVLTTTVEAMRAEGNERILTRAIEAAST